jgi:hypothetical protein
MMDRYEAISTVLEAAMAWETMQVEAGLVPDMDLEYSISQVKELLKEFNEGVA